MSLSLSLSVHISICVYIYIYIYIHMCRFPSFPSSRFAVLVQRSFYYVSRFLFCRFTMFSHSITFPRSITFARFAVLSCCPALARTPFRRCSFTLCGPCHFLLFMRTECTSPRYYTYIYIYIYIYIYSSFPGHTVQHRVRRVC